jgi:uncharacterized protein YbcC (UPF0753/DUF2309 family)
MPTSALAKSLPNSTATDPARSLLLDAIETARQRIAPLWPLKHFVAVNPFLGFTGQSFAMTCATMQRVARARMLMPRSFYRDAINAGLINDEALEAALVTQPRSLGHPKTVAELKAAAQSDTDKKVSPSAVVATIAEVLDSLSDGGRQISLVGFMIDEISSFCAGYFDEGQSSWPMPARSQKPYAAWRTLMRHDRNAEMMGIVGFRRTVLALPFDPIDTIAIVLKQLGIPDRASADYLFRALFDIGGWAAYSRYRGWNAELDGKCDDTLLELLAIRMAWGWGLFQARTDERFRTAWSKAMSDAATLPKDSQLGDDPDLATDLVLQEAYEIAYRKKLIGKLIAHNAAPSIERLPVRPTFQAAFCIDVRSEVFRRAFETVQPNVETIGFAGFFGFPIEYVPIGQVRGGAQCPVLLKPAFTICEAVRGANETEEAEVLGMRLLRRRASKAWKSFKLSAVSSFSFVETMGLGFFGKIATDSAGLTRPVPNPSIDGLDADMAARVGPRLTPRLVADRPTGFTPEQRISMAEAVLKAMSMTGNFARLVLLAGHGSTTVNNPHASGLDCGACGGHTGEANARVAAAILNDPDVRRGLTARNIMIPNDCWFLGALHDTTTDEVKLFDEDTVPSELTGDLARLNEALVKAASMARLERAALLGVQDKPRVDAQVIARSRDWSQVRPEWGLAGNAAFIAAPRKLTRGINLGGRTFLHSYEHQLDASFGVLELIMTAPMVVASWINLQYYGSTVNNDIFGSGNKVLHNVVGQLGVLEGNAGDLRVGLPWQSVHDGDRFVHEPVRLNVFIAAPEAAMETVISRHPGVSDLVTHGWVHLHSLSDDGQTVRRFMGLGVWQPIR